MKIIMLPLFAVLLAADFAMGQGPSLQEKLMYPVYPPRKVFPKEAAATSSVMAALASSAAADPSKDYLESVKLWVAAKSLIDAGLPAQAGPILDDAKERISTLQKKHPDFETEHVSQLLKMVGETKASISQ